MKIVVQRVTEATVTVNHDVVGRIGAGLLCFVGFGVGDTEAVLEPMAQKLIHLRVFAGEGSHFHHSVLEMKREILLVPQFTLYANTSRGRRPDFSHSLKPEQARPLFDKIIEVVRGASGLKVERGVFGADMKVSSVNDGPVTIELASH